ncbi:hypothetical protein MOQ_009968 [Trypanosoma cruzi marinkellei]|uniref:ACB domain-containing protein n=1 Tax=Trypanosoma cruzi marinkellei TaxID=85056 RepID=K2NBA5_TRYCR|nr:hypothetical protein MOQ_009968 [Trypanosoma cruzi marinkellei]
MDYAFPEKYFKVARFFDHEFGDIEATARLDDKQKLLFYALRQQAEHGPCTGAAPSIWRTRERIKYDAWKQLGDMSKFEAMVNFVRLLGECLGGEVNWVEKCRALENNISHAGDGESFTAPDGSGSTHAPGEEDTWDDDVRAHLEPTVENVRYLASQVMRLRREAHQLRSLMAEQQTRGGVALSLASPPIKAPTGSAGPPRKAVPVPPGRPVARRSGNPSPSPPPFSCPPNKVTEVVLRSSRLPFPTPRRRGMGWAEWLGLI